MPDKELKTLSATQSAALFDLSPYTTKWLLWRVFSGIEQMDALDEPENERMFWGKVHEPAIFNEALRRLDLEGRYNEAQDYVRHPKLPVGCTPDGIVWHPDRGPATVQVKSTDWMVWKDQWVDDTPPPQIVCQVQHEMLAMRTKWAVIPCLINGNELRIYEMFPDREFQIEIMRRAKAFFKSVKDGEEPDPLGVDMETPALLKREYKPQEVADLTGSEEAFNAIQALRHYEPLVSAGNKSIKAAKAKLLALSGGAGRIKAHGYGCEIKLSPTKESSVELPKEMRGAFQAMLEDEANIANLDDFEVEALTEAANWRTVTRKAGFTRKYRVWEEATDEAPPWLEPFDVDSALMG